VHVQGLAVCEVLAVYSCVVGESSENRPSVVVIQKPVICIAAGELLGHLAAFKKKQAKVFSQSIN
jgi:hypothetical protein